MEAQRARQHELQAATKNDREFWHAMVDKWEKMAAYAEARGKATVAPDAGARTD